MNLRKLFLDSWKSESILFPVRSTQPTIGGSYTSLFGGFKNHLCGPCKVSIPLWGCFFFFAVKIGSPDKRGPTVHHLSNDETPLLLFTGESSFIPGFLNGATWTSSIHSTTLAGLPEAPKSAQAPRSSAPSLKPQSAPLATRRALKMGAGPGRPFFGLGASKRHPKGRSPFEFFFFLPAAPVWVFDTKWKNFMGLPTKSFC